ncbi:MAG TPA: hypothetical protein VFV99_19295 [Kofleriaceae bacterium]|nr:hypothetical protein [Kofleriaceae bacterium]
MKLVAWAAIGITFGAAVLHAVLGLRRPRDRADLCFASMMAFLALYFYLGIAVDRTQSVDAAVEGVRYQVFALLGCHGSLLLFVPAYTNTRLPSSLTAAYWVGLVILFAANLWSTYGLWFSGPPELVPSQFRHAHYQTVLAPPMSLLQHAYALYSTSYLCVAAGCAASLFKHGGRQRAITFGCALLIVVVTNVVDLARHPVNGSLPYFAEFGFVAWALIMSVQLARDFRAEAKALERALADVAAQSERLQCILDSLRALEVRMLAPIDELENGVATLAATTQPETASLTRLRRAVARLRTVAHAMPDISTTRLAKA